MGEKSVQKKQYIIEKARNVFAQKGYKGVSMKDIVEACDISRGGLYLYYGSTEELFLDVMGQDNADSGDNLGASVKEDAMPSEILALFFKEQKRELLRRKDNISAAIYEFYFNRKLDRKDHALKKQFDAGVLILQKILEAGVEAGEFYCEEPRAAARNIMYVIEGMRVMSQTTGLSESTADKEILYILRGLVVEE